MKRNRSQSHAILLRTVLLLLILLLSQAPHTVQAAGPQVFTVTKGDTGGDTRDGTCSPSDCSLREAVIAANANPGSDTIYLPMRNYKLEIQNPGGIHTDAAYGDLDITDDLTIVGVGFDATGGSLIYANRASFGDRIFHVISPAGRKITVRFSNLRIKDGFTSSEKGGAGILIENAYVYLSRVYLTGNQASNEGGGVTNYNGSVLTVNATTFDTNFSADGGGIYNVGTLYLYSSLLRGNTGSSTGGGIDNGSLSWAEVINTTISENNTDPTSAGGGGITNSGTLIVTNSTIVGNDVTGVLTEAYANTTIRNTIFSQGSNTNCSLKSPANFTSHGFNLVYGDAPAPLNQIRCTFLVGGLDKEGTGDDVNPMLEALDFYAMPGMGRPPTMTYKLGTGSQAIDKIPADNPYCPAGDQRSYPRKGDGEGYQAGMCDIGAHEDGGTFQPLYLTLIRK